MSWSDGRRGLQAERTALSWSRTALAALAPAAVSFKAGLADHDIATYVACGLCTLAALVLYACARVRLNRATSGAVPAPAIRLVAAVVAAAAIATACAVVGQLATI